MSRLSRYFLPTLREDPADAQAASHRLMVRAGLIRQLGAGLWTFLPAGYRVMKRVEQIIREEIDAIGGQEMLMPVLQPAELWRRTGRYEIDELFKLRDRREAELALAMTHEENITYHVAREVRSYRELPMILYHVQTKERDEPRPRAGVLRTREFTMKDSYSFDLDADGLDRSHAQLVAKVVCRMRPRRVEIEAAARADCEPELAAARRKANLFRKVFRRRVRFRAVAAERRERNLEMVSAEALWS